VKVESGLMSDSEFRGGSPRLCRLGPVATSIELCAIAYGLYGTLKTK
jgi:hypothetical protein